ncbi:hypothetical protein Tco_0117401 [Tanacetum coccineum]
MSIQDMEDLKQQYLDEMKSLINIKDYRNENIDIEIKINEIKENFNGMSIEINKKEKLQQLDEIYKSSLTVITPNSSIKNSLIMGDEHLDTIPETESDEENESSSISEYDLIESFLNRYTSIVSSPKFDSLLEEFSEIVYDNAYPRTPEELILENSVCCIESFSPYPILVEGSDSLMEEIDIFLTPDDSMPPGLENDDYDSEGDILFLEELLSNDSPSLLESESFHFDVPSSPRPSAKPPDDGIYFEPDTGLLTAKVVGNISKHYFLMPRILPTQPTLCPVINTLLLFSSENEDKVHLLSYRGFKDFQLFSESPMIIYGGNIPTLDVLYLLFYHPECTQDMGDRVKL